MRFRLSGNWIYAPTEFESDFWTAFSTAYNIEGTLLIWSVKTQEWDLIYSVDPLDQELVNETLPLYIRDPEERKKLYTTEKCNYDFLLEKTDDYFLMGAGRLNFADGIVTERHHPCGGPKIRDCKLSLYGIDLSIPANQREIHIRDTTKTPCSLNEWI